MKWIIFILIIYSQNIFAAEKRGFALSGGVSLGSYEGGIFYQLLQGDKAELQSNTKVVFGASAGSINGLFGILDLCGYRSMEREKSLLSRMWIPIGLNDLKTKDKKTLSLLDRKAIEPLFQEVRERWKEGLNENCDVVFGAAVTRHSPLIEEYKPGLEIIRQPEFFMVRIKGQGKGKFPLVENYDRGNIDRYRTLLPVGETPARDVETLLSLIQASSAFPGAFTPYPISFCFQKPGEPKRPCHTSNTKTEHFIDGGIYHNGPVGYAYDVLEAVSGDRNFSVYYLNASAPLEGRKSESEDKREDDGVVQDFYHLLIDFAVQGRKFELTKSLESNPGLVKHLKTNIKLYPLVSEPLYAFLGFVEKDFRITDFYLGMRDGESISDNRIQDQKYQCFKNYLEGDKTCKLDQNLKILIDLAKYRKTHTFKDKTDFDLVFDYLAKHDFEFKDLGLKRKESKYGKVYFKQRLTDMLNDLVKKQPEKQHRTLGFVVRPGLNFLHYTPPEDYYTALYGSSLEFGFSKIIPTENFATHSFRLNYTLMVNGFSSFFSRAQDIWAITPLIGLEYEPVKMNNAIWQWRAGARIGYVLSPRDDLGRGECDPDLVQESSAACTGATLHLLGAVSVFELLRMQIVFVPFVVDSLSFKDSTEIILQIGLQFDENMWK